MPDSPNSPSNPWKPEKPDGGGAKPGTQVLTSPPVPKERLTPRYHVILHDDDSHTYQYVVAMLVQLFGKQMERAFEHAKEVDRTGVSIVETTTHERAELKRDQIRAFGRDPLLENSKGSMCATIEPAD